MVLRDSPGGDARAGYAVGEMIRARGLTTAVSGFCNSSCSRMFLGGKQRFFSDEQSPANTWVAFHGNYHNGQLIDERIDTLKSWIAKYSDGKANPQLVDRWVRIANHKGFAYFFHRTESPSWLGASRVLLCQGTERAAQRVAQCDKLDMGNALDNGIVTSLEVLHVRLGP